MNSTEVFELFRKQLLRLVEIGDQVKPTAAIAGKPSDALSFAETLLLCPTEDAAKSQMRRDQIGAVAFFQLAKYVDETFGEREMTTGKIDLKHAG